MSAPTASETLAAWVTDLRFSDIDAPTVAYAKELLLDHLGCATRGGTVGTAEAVARMLAAVGADEGSALTAVVAKAPLRPEWAVFANGVHAHSIELDDTHSASSSHPAVVTIPAALATAELQGSSGEELLAAIVAGYEVAGRLGRALDPQQVYARGFHPTGVIGPFAAAAVTAKLLGLASPALAHAFGIAASQAAGRLEFFSDGAWTKRFHPGWASHSGYVAARLAQTGFTGPLLAFEGRDGLLSGYGAGDRAALVTADLGAPFELSQTSVKPYACCRYNQGPIDLAIALASEHDLGPEDIARVRVGVVSQAIPIVVEPVERKLAPANDVDAQFSLPYAIGLGIVMRKATLDEYAEPTLSSPDVRAVAAKVVAEVRPDFDARFPALWPAEVEIETVDGRTLHMQTDFPKGDPQNRLSGEAMSAKFRSLASAVLSDGELDAVESAVSALESDGVGPLIASIGRQARLANASMPSR
jgi:2-methylcitrate dehydratase PrpD